MEKLALGCDHGGYDLKEFLKKNLEMAGYKVDDYGTFSSESVDYPDYVHPVAQAVQEKKYRLAIIICGSGNGANITANKHHGIRSALCWNKEIARLARLHNDANIMSLPGRFIQEDEALEASLVFLNTNFEGGRHITRINKIENV